MPVYRNRRTTTPPPPPPWAAALCTQNEIDPLTGFRCKNNKNGEKHTHAQQVTHSLRAYIVQFYEDINYFKKKKKNGNKKHIHSPSLTRSRTHTHTHTHTRSIHAPICPSLLAFIFIIFLSTLFIALFHPNFEFFFSLRHFRFFSFFYYYCLFAFIP